MELELCTGFVMLWSRERLGSEAWNSFEGVWRFERQLPDTSALQWFKIQASTNQKHQQTFCFLYSFLHED
jgi:hypothetical protein